MNNNLDDGNQNITLENNTKNKTINRLIKDWIIPILIAFILAWIVNRYLIFKIEVPTGSMIPTINVDDKIFVKRVHNKENFKRGDILVFNSNEEDILLIKRLIGLPGDKVNLENGDLYINGSLVEEPYVKNKFDYTNEFIVPKEHLLFFGDNRATSRDGRFWENPYIHIDEVIGEGGLRIYPFNNIGFIK